MTWTGRNRRFLVKTGRDLVKKERVQTGTDDRGEAIYGYPASEQTTIKALWDMPATKTDKGRSEVGTREHGEVVITIDADVSLNQHTRFELGGFEWNIEQTHPTREGLRDLVLKRVAA